MKEQKDEKQQSTTIKRGELVKITTKERSFHASAVRDFSPFHSMIYPVKDLDRGGVLGRAAFSGRPVGRA